MLFLSFAGSNDVSSLRESHHLQLSEVLIVCSRSPRTNCANIHDNIKKYPPKFVQITKTRRNQMHSPKIVYLVRKTFRLVNKNAEYQEN